MYFTVLLGCNKVDPVLYKVHDSLADAKQVLEHDFKATADIDFVQDLEDGEITTMWFSPELFLKVSTQAYCACQRNAEAMIIRKDNGDCAAVMKIVQAEVI